MHKKRFLQYLQFEKRYSQHTVIAYTKDLEQFCSFLVIEYNISDIREVDHFIIRSWIVQLVEQSVTARTINRKLSTLKRFYKFLLSEGVIINNPASMVSALKVSKKLPVYVEESKMDLLLDEIEFKNSFSGLRDKLIIELFYFTGIRLSELINIHNRDIDIKNKKLKVLGKRNKERIIPISNILADNISSYNKERNSFFSHNETEDYLFLTDKGKKLYEKFVYGKVRLYLSKVSTINKKSPHVLRHTFATHMLNNGADLNTIKEILGHSNLAATQIYTHNTIEQLKNTYKQAHPRA